MSVRAIQKLWKGQPTIEGAGVHPKRAFGFHLLLVLLIGATSFARPVDSWSQPIIMIGIGDKPEELAARSPELVPYLAAIREKFEGVEALGRQFDEEINKCKKENAELVSRGLKPRDCDEELAPIDPPEVHEPATAMRATLAYRDKKAAFDVPGITMLRLRYGLDTDGANIVREITTDLRPAFPDVSGVVKRFDELAAMADKVQASLDRSGLPRYQDKSASLSLKTRIFSLKSLRRDLEETQLTDQLRSRCGGHYKYLLGAWANDQTLALLTLTGEQDGDIIGEKAGTDHGWRLRVIAADNSLIGGRFRPVDSWVNSFPWVPPMEWQGLSPVAKPMVVVARTDEDWSKLWKAIGRFAPCASFKGYFAVAVFLGPRPTIGFSVEWTMPPAEKYNVVSYRVKESRAASRGVFQPYAVRLFPYAGGEIRVEAPRE